MDGMIDIKYNEINCLKQFDKNILINIFLFK